MQKHDSIDIAVASALLQESPKLRKTIVEKNWYVTMINVCDYGNRTKKQMVILDPETQQIFDLKQHRAHATRIYNEYAAIPEDEWYWC